MTKPSLIIIAALLSLSTAPMAVAAPGDHLCKASLFGKTARLWLENDTPVKYQWSNRSNRKAEMRGNTIYIQADPTATLSNVVIGKTSGGQKAIKGDWKFRDAEQSGVTFTCKAR